METLIAASTMNSQMRLMTNIGTALMKKTMDVSKENANQMIESMKKQMELSVNPNVGSNFDMKI